MLPSTRLLCGIPMLVVPPSELRCYGRRLMVQSLSASHASLHRSHSPIAIITSVESAELELDCNLQSISASIEAVCRKTVQDVNRDSEAKTRPAEISVKNYMSYIIVGVDAVGFAASMPDSFGGCRLLARTEVLGRTVTMPIGSRLTFARSPRESRMRAFTSSRTRKERNEPHRPEP